MTDLPTIHIGLLGDAFMGQSPAELGAADQLRADSPTEQ